MAKPIQFPTENPGKMSRDEMKEKLKQLEEEMSKQPQEEDEKIKIPTEAKSDKDEDDFLLPDPTGYFDNSKVRKAVESRCGELRFDDLITTGKIQQKVPIRPKQLEFIFQTITGEDEVFVSEQAYQETRGGITHPKVYLLMEISLGIYSINSRAFPPYVNDKGERDPKLFKERWKHLSNLPASIIKRLHENYLWFVERVDKLSVLEDLKNG